MHFISDIRFNPQAGCEAKYYRIKESFRDRLGKVHSRVMLNVGFLSGFRPEDIRDIGKGLTYLYDHQGEKEVFGNPFERYSERVQEHIHKFWQAMVEAGSIDSVKRCLKEADEKAKGCIVADTMRHTEVCDMGAEWLCLQAINQLKLRDFLELEGWSKARIDAAISSLVTRTVYTPSELKSIRIMDENSAVCEMVYGDENSRPSYKSVYRTAPDLFQIKEKLERHLCAVTDNLFNLQNRIFLFDLTNFYFESRKDASAKARFGRSKEKRSDCKLLVLALCINAEGFIRYSSILEGNTADPASLPDMIENVIAAGRTSVDAKTLVVIDAGIATEDNLNLIKSKGYNYLCVSRKRLTDYELHGDEESVVVHDSLKREIRLTRVQHEEGGDYFLQVNSPMKALKESSMNRQWRERFECELNKAKDGLAKKGGTKRYEKVIERVGRAMQKYPSIAKFYRVTYTRSSKDPALMSNLTWEIRVPQDIDTDCGKYFLRTNVATLDERTTWDYYNLIREIETTNRQLKTDLSLRPIYHQKDETADAHLFFGMLAYWVVNTIRHQLKQHGINHFWTEIVRIMQPQKIVTTQAENPLGETLQYRVYSDPPPAARRIYAALHYKDRPFRRKKKICSTQ